MGLEVLQKGQFWSFWRDMHKLIIFPTETIDPKTLNLNELSTPKDWQDHNE
jgi:hypothetical protein